MSIESENESQLQAKLSECATTLLDKKVILDARDKLLRLKQERQTDLATAVAVVGTCPDMCPEHERYFRIETNQVSPFEMDFSQDQKGVADQNRMIKEYRRSGADQKEPLSHELRPINVLERTMNYLCLEIIDQYEECSNIGEWFDFIWSRTRSIRKDITQQHLISLESVALIEKCARFHIFCSYYLCEEEIKDFDPKINEENLSNCIQTLKDFYYDLSLRSIKCPNESEFRAYDILLNLRNGETLSELKHFKHHARNSLNVKFAIKIYQAYHSKNYIRFFQYCREASFFMSCILNRYFNLFRIDLFNIMRKAYTTSKSNSLVPYPVVDIIRQLGFDDYDELCYFCDYVDLKYDSQNIYLRRNLFIETTIIKSRSKNLVLKKLESTPGRAIIADDNLSIQVEIFPVHSSFDKNNRLIFDQSFLSNENSTYSNVTSTSVPTLPENLFTTFKENKTEFKENNQTSLKSNFPNTSSTQLGNNFANSFSFNIQAEKLNVKKTVSNENSKSGSFFNFPSKAIANKDEPNFSSFNFNIKNQTLESQDISKPLQQSNDSGSVSDSDLESNLKYSLAIDKLKKNLFDEAVDEVIAEKCDSSFKYLKTIKILTQKETNRLYITFLDTIIKEVVENFLQQERRRKQLIIRLSSYFTETYICDVLNSLIGEVFIDIQTSNLKHRISLISLEIFEQLFGTVLFESAQSTLRKQIELHEDAIKEWRYNFLCRKYLLKWRKFYLFRKKYSFYRDTFPAAPIMPNVLSSVSSCLYLNKGTLIDDHYIKSDNTIKRKLVYSKYNDTNEMRKRISEQLKNKQLNRTQLSEVELLNRIHFLSQKYFQLWLRKVRRSKRNFVRTNFPAAPLNASSFSISTINLPVNKPRTIIDTEIQNANLSIQKNLLRKLNYDFDSTINLIKRKLGEREQRRLANESCRIAPSGHLSNYQSDCQLEPLRKRLTSYSLSNYVNK